MTSAKGKTNEWEFQGELLNWLNEEIKKRAGLGLDRATQEKPRYSSGKRNDLVVWVDRPTEKAFLTVELKTPTTRITDPVLLQDANEKAQKWGAPFFAIWNMQEAELYRTPADGKRASPSDRIYVWSSDLSITSIEDWLDPICGESLKHRALHILDTAWSVSVSGGSLITIDPVIFVERLANSLHSLRTTIYKKLSRESAANPALRKQLKSLAASQGFAGFVTDIVEAIAGQIGYRFIGQILFYFALRRKQPALKKIVLAPKAELPEALRPYWDDVRRFDYEALYKEEEFDSLIELPASSQLLLRDLIEQFEVYDWTSLRDDVLGSIFEHLIPREEQILLGQFYTPRPVSDLIVSFTVSGKRPLVLDPGCGSGTFLMSTYEYVNKTTGMEHKEILPILWGFDISPFAAELAAINLFRQDMTEYDNFPRIVSGDFFDREVGEKVSFPPPQTSEYNKIPIPIPQFDAIVGNPPYLRSQNQDDLSDSYKSKLQNAAAKLHIKPASKSDLFLYFIYHAVSFMKPGGRLGFVTSSSWLSSDFARPLQDLLFTQLKLVAIVNSTAESFFSQVDINTSILIVERRTDSVVHTNEQLKFVVLKKNLKSLFGDAPNHWVSLVNLVDRVEEATKSVDENDYRIKVVKSIEERDRLRSEEGIRNWSKYLRAPLSYYQLIGDE